MTNVLKLKISPTMDKTRMTEDLHKEGIDACFTPSSNRLFSEYMIGPIIGRGGFSVVRAARCKKSGQEMAVKILDKAKHIGSVKRVRRLKDEMRVLASLRHPNIISLISIFENDHELMLVMERAHGGELFDRIVSRGHFTERDAAVVARGMFSALEHLHKHGVMHRDVKPENLLLQHPLGWEVKLSDFGLVGLLEDTWKQSHEVSKPTKVTPTQADKSGVPAEEKENISEVVNIQTLCGSSYYIAPEIVLRERYGVEVDVWSAGVVMYIMLCGSPPFETSPAIVPDWHITFPHSWGWNAVSDSAKHLISGMLIQYPGDRFTATACLQHAWSTENVNGNLNCLSPTFPGIFKRFNDKRKRSMDATITPRNRNGETFVVSPPRHKKRDVELDVAIDSLSLKTDELPPVPISLDVGSGGPPMPPMSQDMIHECSSNTARTEGASEAGHHRSPLTSESNIDSTKTADIESLFQEHDAWAQSSLTFHYSPKNQHQDAHTQFASRQAAQHILPLKPMPRIPSVSSTQTSADDSNTGCASSSLEYDTLSSDEED